MYDFILFENIYSLENHYVDLGNLAYLLKKSGYRVAFANVFKEKQLIKEDGIDIIPLKFKCPKFLLKKTKRSGVINFIYRFLSSLYLIYAVLALKNKAENFYIGSLTLGTPIIWLMFLSPKKNYFLWGLRCHMLELWKKSHSLYGFYSKCLFCIVSRKKNIKIIVSHPIIKEEFTSRLNIESNRIIIRPERFIRGNVQLRNKIKNEGLTLLTIGTLRRSKHVENIIDALRQMNDSCIKYIIAGRCKNDIAYESMLNEKVKGLNGIDRRNRFIPEEEYEALMQSCDFMVLCDEQEASCATNGTMAEALLHGMPIIAPDYNPFKYEVETLNIGILYDINSVDSIINALYKAKNDTQDKYYQGINQYMTDNADNKIVLQLKEQLRDVLDK